MPFLARVALALALSLGLAWALLRPPPSEAEHRDLSRQDEPPPDPAADLALARSLADSDPDVAAALGITDPLGREAAEETWRKARSAFRRLGERTRLPQVARALREPPLAPSTLSDLARVVLLQRLLERHSRQPTSALFEAGPGPTLEARLAQAVPVTPVPDLAWGPAEDAAAARAAVALLGQEGEAWSRLDRLGSKERLRMSNPRGEAFVITVDGFTTALAEGIRSKETQDEQDRAKTALEFPLGPGPGDLELLVATQPWAPTLHLTVEVLGAAPAAELPLDLPDSPPVGKGPEGSDFRVVVRIRFPAASLPASPRAVRFRALGLQPLAASRVTRRIDYLLGRDLR